MSKYNNKKVNGFDSLREMGRYQELQLMERAGKIQGLERQVRFDLIPNQTYWKDHQYIVEDCKGFRTKEYQIKKKLMYYFHHIKIKET